MRSFLTLSFAVLACACSPQIQGTGGSSSGSSSGSGGGGSGGGGASGQGGASSCQPSPRGPPYPSGAIAAVDDGIVRIFESGAGDHAKPLASLTVPQGARGVAFDDQRNLYVLVHGDDGHKLEVWVYATGSKGNDGPVRQIAGAQTRLWFDSPAGAAVDSAGLIYVANSEDVLVFEPCADGDVAPLRRLTVSPAADDADAVAIDAQARLIVGRGFGGVEVFPLDATGFAKPAFKFGGSGAGCVAVAPSGWVLTCSGGGATVFAYDEDTGEVRAKIHGLATGFGNNGVKGLASGIAVEASGRILVGTLTRLLAFAPDADGNVAPIATIWDERAIQVAVAP
jgi:hypothetical protein